MIRWLPGDNPLVPLISLWILPNVPWFRAETGLAGIQMVRKVEGFASQLKRLALRERERSRQSHVQLEPAPGRKGVRAEIAQ